MRLWETRRLLAEYDEAPSLYRVYQIADSHHILRYRDH